GQLQVRHMDRARDRPAIGNERNRDRPRGEADREVRRPVQGVDRPVWVTTGSPRFFRDDGDIGRLTLEELFDEELAELVARGDVVTGALRAPHLWVGDRGGGRPRAFLGRTVSDLSVRDQIHLREPPVPTAPSNGLVPILGGRPSCVLAVCCPSSPSRSSRPRARARRRSPHRVPHPRSCTSASTSGTPPSICTWATYSSSSCPGPRQRRSRARRSFGASRTTRRRFVFARATQRPAGSSSSRSRPVPARSRR